MQNAQTVTKPWYRQCSRCGKPTFSDLLDSEGMCDYCREVRSMKAAVVRNGRKRKTLK
jgi:DNA-directed RNA polymerase subunit RPC12/RpoP